MRIEIEIGILNQPIKKFFHLSRRLNSDEPHPNGESPGEPLGKRLRKNSTKSDVITAAATAAATASANDVIT
jgi:hypothetical protein